MRPGRRDRHLSSVPSRSRRSNPRSKENMTSKSDDLTERLGRAHTSAGGADRLLWRTSLGQATFELLAEGKAVTVDSLIVHLEASVRPDDLVHRGLSIHAAIEVLRSLAAPPDNASNIET